MKIHLWAPQFAEGGGVQAFSAELARALYDHEVTLFAQRDSSFEQQAITPSGARLPLLRLRFAIQLIRKSVLDRPDLIISTHVNFGPIAFIAKRIFGIPYILIGHGIDIDPNLSLVRKTSIAYADCILGVSNFSITRFKALRINLPKNIAVLPNTLDHERFTIGSRSIPLLAQHNIAPNKKVVLTVCRLSASERYKGYDQIIRGFPRVIELVPEAHFIIVGKGDDRSRIEDLVDEYRLWAHITLAGFVCDDQLADYYRTADVFAMPSKAEGFGIVFLEAMACGTPVLAGYSDGSVDALANGEIGLLVDPDSPTEIANGIVQLLRRDGPDFWFDPVALRTRMLAKFGRDQFARSLYKIIESL